MRFLQEIWEKPFFNQLLLSTASSLGPYAEVAFAHIRTLFENLKISMSEKGLQTRAWYAIFRQLLEIHLSVCDLQRVECVCCAPLQVCVEVLVEYPFFVFGQGWSSCCPDRTTQLFELSCAKLCVGDVCVSLTLRSLRNGSATDGQALAAKLKTSHLSDYCHSVEATVRNSLSPNAGGNTGLLMKASGGERLERKQVAGPGLGLVPGSADGIYGAGPVLTVSGTGEVRQESVKTDMPALTRQCDLERPATRKRRWSAPERDQTERAEDEPPPTLPKPSFVPQEVKISIEGHSSTGSERFLSRRVDC